MKDRSHRSSAPLRTFCSHGQACGSLRGSELQLPLLPRQDGTSTGLSAVVSGRGLQIQSAPSAALGGNLLRHLSAMEPPNLLSDLASLCLEGGDRLSCLRNREIQHSDEQLGRHPRPAIFGSPAHPRAAGPSVPCDRHVSQLASAPRFHEIPALWPSAPASMESAILPCGPSLRPAPPPCRCLR